MQYHNYQAVIKGNNVKVLTEDGKSIVICYLDDDLIAGAKFLFRASVYIYDEPGIW
jgi:hypothetical protein